MTTKRVPISRPVRREITLRAIKLFRKMERIECTCAPRNWAGEYWRHRFCEGCERWWELHSSLHDELRLPPHHWPAYEDPEAGNPYPERSEAARRWQRNERACAMYRELEAADRAGRARPRSAPRADARSVG